MSNNCLLKLADKVEKGLFTSSASFELEIRSVTCCNYLFPQQNYKHNLNSTLLVDQTMFWFLSLFRHGMHMQEANSCDDNQNDTADNTYCDVKYVCFVDCNTSVLICFSSPDIPCKKKMLLRSCYVVFGILTLKPHAKKLQLSINNKCFRSIEKTTVNYIGLVFS